jgi:hypothetical protein
LCVSHFNVCLSIVYNCKYVIPYVNVELYYVLAWTSLDEITYIVYTYMNFAEIGDSDKERWIHAILSLTFHLPNEHLFLNLRITQRWYLHLCKFLSSPHPFVGFVLQCCNMYLYLCLIFIAAKWDWNHFGNDPVDIILLFWEKIRNRCRWTIDSVICVITSSEKIKGKVQADTQYFSSRFLVFHSPQLEKSCLKLTMVILFWES